MSDLSTAPQAGTHSLLALDTPCLILDEARMNSNIARLRSRLYAAGVALRPHLKTAKSLDVSRRLENVLPEVARDIDAALRLPVPACARALLAVARQVAPDLVPPGAAEAVERVLARAEGAAR